MPPAPTARLRFCPWRPELRQDFATLALDPEVVRYIPPGTPYTDERIDAFLARQQRYEAEHGHSMWWLGRSASSPPRGIGFCGIQPVPATGEVEIGWWLQPRHQGQGLATEAARAVLAWAWNHTDLDRIVAVTLPENEGSWRVMERLSMQRLGPVPAKDRGLPHLDADLLVYAIRRPVTDRSAT